jgi:hypothetical protein
MAQADGKYKVRSASIDAPDVLRLRETMGRAAIASNSASRAAASTGC